MGKDAAGSWGRRVTPLNSTPPGARKAAAREVMGLLRAKGQVGCPPGIFTDAQLGFCLGAVKVADRYWFVSKALAQAPIPARRMNWPSGPKWDIVHVVHKQCASQYCLGTRWKHSPMAKHVGCRCGVDKDRGRRDGSQRVPMPCRWVISHVIRVGQHHPSVGPPPNSSMIGGYRACPAQVQIATLR